MPNGDLGALAQAVVAMSNLGTHPQVILEAEANPVMVTSNGATAADALVTLAEEVSNE